ncbi:MAG: hypothetical protein JRE57_06620, partial [Deltaproteobacteria bacterium]|nr:hypothetical protein [Deltaproteobacteria bacterium]
MKAQDKKVKASKKTTGTPVGTETVAATTEKPEEKSGATRAVSADELDPGRERRPLESYFQEIGGTRTLRREEEVILAKELESATAELREALYAIPCSARHVVARWDALRALSHTGAKLSESVGDEETGEIAARVERAVKRLRTLLSQREAPAAKDKDGEKELAKIDAKIVKELKGAHLSLVLLAELRQKVIKLRKEMRATRRGTKKYKE